MLFRSPSLREMTAHDVERKFRRLAGVVLDDRTCAQVIERVRALDEARDLSHVVPLLVAQRT